MWTFKFIVKHEGCIYSPKCERFKIIDQVHPINYYVKDEKIYMTAVHITKGDEKKLKRYYDALSKDKRVSRVSGDPNMFYTLAVQPMAHWWLRYWYAQDIFYTEPIFQDIDGYETVSVASWDRKPLADLLDAIKSNRKIYKKFRILSFKRATPQDIFVTYLTPKLSEKQQAALRVAVDSGYYSYPHKTRLSDMAAAMGITTGTFQEHLRKAEAKLFPSLFSSLRLMKKPLKLRVKR